MSHATHRETVKPDKSFWKGCGTDGKSKTLLKYSTKF